MPSETHPPKRHFSLQLSIASAFVSVVILTSVLLGISTYFNVRKFVRQGIKERLVDAVGIAALKIDAQSHKTIVSDRDEESPAYQDIVRYLRQVRDRSKDIRFVYTIRQNKQDQIYFVTDAEENPEQVSHVGDLYVDPTPAMLAAFKRPYTVQVEKRFFADQWGTFLSSYGPILDANGELEGVIGMDISVDKVLAYERHYLIFILSISVMVCLLVLVIGYLLSKMISRPLLLLEADMRSIQSFHLDSEVEVVSRVTEVINMKRALDNMKNGLRSFRKYVPAQLVAELMRLGKEAVLDAEKREITIFFSDIADFTTISEQLPPEELAEKLAAYLEGMTHIILEHKGTVDKFIGDAIMAFWNAPTPNADHAVLACRAALKCQKFLEDFNRGQGQRAPVSFVTRIGIHTGEAIVGNMGFEERLSYTAIGDRVNTASRLESLNKYYGTRILISGDTCETVQENIIARQVDMVAVKGKKQAIPIYELVAEKAAADAEQLGFTARHNEGMQLYLAKQWQAGLEVFTELCDRKPDDQPARILLERCRKYLLHPPPDDWEGVVVMREK